MINEFLNTQPIATKILINSINRNKISHAYLIESNGYTKSMEFALSLAKSLVCPNNITFPHKCKKCQICDKIDHGNFTELKIIEPDGLWIKKEQLEELQEEFSKKPIESKYRIYIIKDVEKLNKSSANSILKFLEEPEDGIIAILITNNVYQVLNTIKSRCQIISLKNTNNNILSVNNSLNTISKVLNLHCNDNALQFNEEKVQEQMNSAVNFVLKIEKINSDVLLELETFWNTNFSSKEDLIFGFDLIILYYKDVLNVKLNRKIEIFDEQNKNLKLIAQNNSQIKLCDKIKKIMQLQDRIKYNANISLLMDKLIIELEAINND